MGNLNDLSYELLKHPASSPDLTPSDFHLFPNIKKHLAVKCFRPKEKLIAMVDGYFSDNPEPHFGNGIFSLENHWTGCSELKLRTGELMHF